MATDLSTLDHCSFMTTGAVMPFCKGCGHGHILKKLNDALIQLQLNPMDVCLVTDIGCIGLADALFDKVHTVHTTHGRSTAFATGIAFADKILAEKKLKTIVLIGDGGSMIGLLHIVNAALFNTDVTVLVANNFLFGMTGGQQSSFTPVEFITQTTPDGNIVPPLDICNVVLASKAEFAARKTATDKDLVDTIAAAINHNGFSLVEILELCPEHAVSRNDLKGNSLGELAEEHGHTMGMLHNGSNRKEFGEVYLSKHAAAAAKKEEPYITPVSSHALHGPAGIIVAGSAGERVQSSASQLCEAALRCGLYTTQKNDNPVTQGSGFSLSEVIISPEEIHYTGVDSPAAVIAVSQDGYKELRAQGVIERITQATVVLLDESIEGAEIPHAIRYPLRKLCSGPKAAMGAVNLYLSLYKPFPAEEYRKLAAKRNGEYHTWFKEDYYKLTGEAVAN